MKKILIVEDETLVSELLERKLSREGYLVYVARDGEKGLELLRTQTPQLVLLDMTLPKQSGFEVLQTIHKDEALRQIPVIIISNSGEAAELERAKTLGISDWLVKTEFDPQEVVDKVKKHLEENPNANP